MSTTSVAVAGPLAVAILTIAAFRFTDSRNSPGRRFSHARWFPEPESRIQTGTPSRVSFGAAATAQASADALICQGLDGSAAAAFGAAAAFAFGAGLAGA